MKRMLGQFAPGVWVAKDCAGRTVAALVSAPDGAKRVKEFYASLRNGPKFPFDPIECSKFTWEVASRAPTSWNDATLKAWAKNEIGTAPDFHVTAEATW